MSHETSTMISSKLLKEFNLTYLFIKSDLFAVFVPGALTLFASWIVSGASLSILPLYFLYSLSYSFLFLYTVCLSSQLLSIEEDRRNKPWRPLPSNLVTIPGTYSRGVFANILLVLLAHQLNILYFAVLWQLVTFFTDRMRWHIFLGAKNLVFMTMGVFALFCSQWQIIQPLDASIYQYAIVLSIWSGFAFHIQDMRDQAGDQLVGRKTLPLAIGDRNARIVLALFFLVLSPLIILLLFATNIPIERLISSSVLNILFILILLFNWFIAYRILKFRTASDDHKSYTSFLYLFCLLIFLIGVIRW
ncbi:UbiA family prenyltransferase [Olivibacter domesticus]|uniref:4-hydroxybenzoate polyprenyltransferase n=1 Tax=Olivibacter domesticus TaxID=407022 RepID=A0A1H7UCD3_OLID1|nr:UbiA family prenyltransferase [Olivibacter domesticus]SEL94345.1 4-hydroxybenzoate polyprenyltransferase [Olivibacter domesticus]